MGKKRSAYVLVADDQVPVTPAEALARVKDIGVNQAAAVYCISTSTLRQFLADAGYKSVRTQNWVQMPSEGPPEPEVTSVAAGDVLDPR